MKIPKPSPAAVKLFEQLTPEEASVSTRMMFGQPAAFTNGNLFFGVFGEKLFVRLSEADRTEALRRPGFATFEPMPGRAMAEYVVLPPPVLKSRAQSRRWVDQSYRYVSLLPSKASQRRGR
jgi:TfoX/Sxy family transcriptional regulator of competence genes